MSAQNTGFVEKLMGRLSLSVGRENGLNGDFRLLHLTLNFL